MSDIKISVQDAKKFGFVFPLAKKWLTPDNIQQLAQDAALVTTANAGIPSLFTTFLDSTVIDILTAPLAARALLGEVKKGSWTDTSLKYRVQEMTGRTAPYNDFANTGMSGVNFNWPTREQYLFQTQIYYGDFEEASLATAQINYVAEKQRSAANTIDMDANKFYLFGIDQRQIYGFLNDPNMPAAETAPGTGADGSTSWDDKTTNQRFEDILFLFRTLVSQTQGWISKDTPLTLAMSPERAVYLATATDFNVSVQDMLDKYFTNLTIVTIPELSNISTGERMILFAREVRGMPAGEFAFSEKMRAGRVIQQHSSHEQKYTSTTYGFLLYLPYAFVHMIGM